MTCTPSSSSAIVEAILKPISCDQVISETRDTHTNETHFIGVDKLVARLVSEADPYATSERFIELFDGLDVLLLVKDFLVLAQLGWILEVIKVADAATCSSIMLPAHAPRRPTRARNLEQARMAQVCHGDSSMRRHHRKNES